MEASQLIEPAPPPPPVPVNAPAYAFVQQLAHDLSGSTLELPGYPKVALRVQRLLGEETVSNDRVVRVLGAEPALVARILTLANSAAHNPSSKTVGDVRTAIVRLGFDALRTAVISFAVMQQRNAVAFKSILRPMRDIWEHSVEVSAVCFALARLERRFNPDTAMLTGIVSGVGKLYILTRAAAHPELFEDAEAYREIEHSWHANVAQALLEHWQLADEITRAVRDYENVESEVRRTANLADLLYAAQLLVACKDAPERLQAAIDGSPALGRLGLTAKACEEALMESTHEIAALRTALGD